MPRREPARRGRPFAAALILTLLAACSRAKEGAPTSNPVSGAPLRAQAVRLLREGEPRSALELLRKHGNPADADDAYLTGEAALRSGRYTEAEKAYRRVLSGRPGDLDASLRLARLAWLQARYEDARQQLDWLLARSPDRVEARALRAMVRFRLGDLDGAASDARKWSELAPREAEPLRIVGAIHLQRGEVGESIRALRQAVEVSPTHVPSRLDLARALARDGQSRLSEEMFREAGRLEREQREAAARRAEASYDRARAAELVKQGKTAEAGEAFARALERDPDNPDLLREAGETAMAAGKMTQAREYLDRGVKLAPGNAMVRRVRGEILLAAGDAEGSLQDLQEAARLDPSDPAPHRSLGRAYSALHRPEAERESRTADELEKLAAPPPLAEASP